MIESIYIILSLMLSIYLVNTIFYNAKVEIAPIIGLMVGALVSKIEYENTIEYNFQICLFIIAITIIWEKPIS